MWRSLRCAPGTSRSLERRCSSCCFSASSREESTIGSLHAQLRRGAGGELQLARRMENRGLITRSFSKDDARIRFLKLTPRGEKRLTGIVIALEGERSRLLELIESLDGKDAR